MVRETSSSSVARIRGPASKSATWEPSSVKTDATWTPVAPAPTTSSDSGTVVSVHASRCEPASSAPGTGRVRLVPPAHTMTLSARSLMPWSASMV